MKNLPIPVALLLISFFGLASRLLADSLEQIPDPGTNSLVGGVDYAESKHAGSWLRHPVFGDPSFDSFERVSGNPIHRGSPPFEWPVNGFFFADPVSSNWFAYIGDYCRGYAGRVSRCLLYRSMDRGHSWEDLGVVLHGDPALFDKDGHTPDVSVVFADSRYHLVYDWGESDFNREGGLAYAWAERPEGPFHRAPQPITRNTTLKPLLGKYQRTYAPTLIQRKSDWLIAAVMDSAPNSWALFTMTALKPEGPYSERQLVRHVEGDYYHPPLLEFFPGFTHAGYLYMPATSVALNRNFNVIFRAPLERAAEESAWEIIQHGSVWHAADVESEFFGLWGQTFSGWVDAGGNLQAMFNSRDSHGLGTVNFASRSWSRPLRGRGFVLSGHEGPAFTCLMQAWTGFRLEAALHLNGLVRIFWDYRGLLGPNQPQADSTLHPMMRSHYSAIELGSGKWRALRVDRHGEEKVLASGQRKESFIWNFTLSRNINGAITFREGKEVLWDWKESTGDDDANPGPIGILVQSHSYLTVDHFLVSGPAKPVTLNYLYTEALLGAGEKPGQWDERHDLVFRNAIGAVSKHENARVKWNVMGRRVSLWSPRGPEFGRAEVLVNGVSLALINLHNPEPLPSSVVWTSEVLSGDFHAVVLRGQTGLLPVDCLEVKN